jgi:hypothetical protein
MVNLFRDLGRMKPLVSVAPIALFSLALLAGCAGSASEQQRAAALPVANLHATARTIELKPSRLDFGAKPAGELTQVVITGGSGPYSLTQSNADIANVTQPELEAGTWSFDVYPVAGGTTIITVRDKAGATTSMSVKQDACRQRFHIDFHPIYPRPDATHVPLRTRYVYVSTMDFKPYRKLVHYFNARLVGSDASIVSGDDLRIVPKGKTSPPGSASLPPDEYLAAAAIPGPDARRPGLQTGITYRLFFWMGSERCDLPRVVGSFST